MTIHKRGLRGAVWPRWVLIALIVAIAVIALVSGAFVIGSP